ncbi:MAG TPA: hypothetical protein GXZ82_09575 [Firmicutes bacterium]|jgi:hypothetical protein|nr:hypothetical protein [Bacillota bacterium]
MVHQVFAVPTPVGNQSISIMQYNLGDAQMTFPPHTTETEIAGYPACISSDEYTLSIDTEGDIESAAINKADQLTVLVQEDDGEMTVIRLSGGQSVDVLVRIAESMLMPISP